MKKLILAVCAVSATLTAKAYDTSNGDEDEKSAVATETSVSESPLELSLEKPYDAFAYDQRLSLASSKSSKSSSSYSEDYSCYMGYYIQYNSLALFDNYSLNSISAGFQNTIQYPTSSVFWEIGIGLQYAFKDKDGIKYNWFAVKLPINFGYNIEVEDLNLLIAPYAGINLRAHIFGKYKVGDYDCELFKSKDDDGLGWKWFQVGWQVGLRAVFSKKILIGVSYGTDFTSYYKDADKLSTLSVTLGFVH